MGDDGRTRVEQLMMAPNPHWWAEDAEVYYYKDRYKFKSFYFILVFWVAFTGLPMIWPPTQYIVLLLGIVGLVWMLISASLAGDPPVGHFQTRYTFITHYCCDRILVHESMRDLVSIEPINSLKNGKLKYHEVAFWNGCKIKIYPSLERHDELIAKLNGFLSANCQQQSVDC